MRHEQHIRDHLARVETEIEDRRLRLRMTQAFIEIAQMPQWQTYVESLRPLVSKLQSELCTQRLDPYEQGFRQGAHAELLKMMARPDRLADILKDERDTLRALEAQRTKLSLDQKQRSRS